MDQVDIGLRHRLERIVRQIGSQHRSLGVLYNDLTTAFANHVATRTSDLCGYYTEAVRAHFSLEETCLFPACRGLSPEIESELAALCLEHEFLIDEMKKLQKRVLEEDAENGKRALDDFHAVIAAHETKEEQMVRGLLVANAVGIPMRDSSAVSRI